MLEARETIDLDAPLVDVWSYVSDIGNWARNMPGYQSFELIDERESLWTLKVGLGALVRTVGLRVEITEWDEPDHVAFRLRGITDPVEGHGTYDARAADDSETAVDVTLRLSGTGPMANAMEGMARPVIPRIVSGLTEAIKRDVESAVGAADAAQARDSAELAPATQAQGDEQGLRPNSRKKSRFPLNVVCAGLVAAAWAWRRRRRH